MVPNRRRRSSLGLRRADAVPATGANSDEQGDEEQGVQADDAEQQNGLRFAHALTDARGL